MQVELLLDEQCVTGCIAQCIYWQVENQPSWLHVGKELE